MGARLRCRAARRSDIPDLVRFQLGCARESEGLELDGAECQRGVRAVFSRPSRGRYFVCERGGRKAGCLLIQQEWSDWRNGVAWWIHSVFVDPAHRGQGVYAALYAHVQALALADPKVLALRLYVESQNTVAQAAYEKLGMSSAHYRMYEWMKGPRV